MLSHKTDKESFFAPLLAIAISVPLAMLAHNRLGIVQAMFTELRSRWDYGILASLGLYDLNLEQVAQALVIAGAALFILGLLSRSFRHVLVPILAAALSGWFLIRA